MGAVEDLTTPLTGSIVALEPLRPDHAEGLWKAAQAPEIWAWLANIGEDRKLFDHWLELTFEAAAEGREGPFATRDVAGGSSIPSGPRCGPTWNRAWHGAAPIDRWI
jgi:N-acetyltransferase